MIDGRLRVASKVIRQSRSGPVVKASQLRKYIRMARKLQEFGTKDIPLPYPRMAWENIVPNRKEGKEITGRGVKWVD